MESVRSAFHAQLATVMDSLLAAAVCEIAKIFESSLCEQQVELVQKNEEISVLRNKLEKVERRQKLKSAEEEEMSTVDREGPFRQQSVTGSGNDVSSHPNLAASLKEEVTGHDGALIKHEFSGSRPSLDSVAASASEGTLAAAEQMHVDDLSATQDKNKLSQWDQDSCNIDHKTLHEQVSPPFLSISQSGHCSPKPNLSLGQPGEWLPGLDTTRGGVSSLLQAGGPTCSGPAISSTAKDASCFRQGFGSDETSNEDDSGAFPFLDQESESQNSVSRHGVGHRDSRQDQPQTPSSESQWRPRDDGVGRITITHARRAASFNSRDHLRVQSNSQLLTLRHANAVARPPAASGGSGRPYTCPYCTKCFTYPSHQRRHLLRHTGVRLHPCQFCDKSFLTPSELTVHTRTHTGERPFGCAQCGKRFARSGNLRAHQRDVHMGKRPFACTECGKRFAHRGNLRVHNHRVHRGERYCIDDQQEPDIGPNPI